MNASLPLLLKIAGLLHLGLIGAGLMMPRATGLKRHVATLPPFVRQLFWVYYAFIGLCLVSFGVLTFTFADVLAEGTALTRALCAFFGLFWLLRLIVATFVFDVSPYITNNLWRMGYHATNVVFAYLPVIYFWVAWKGGKL